MDSEAGYRYLLFYKVRVSVRDEVLRLYGRRLGDGPLRALLPMAKFERGTWAEAVVTSNNSVRVAVPDPSYLEGPPSRPPPEHRSPGYVGSYGFEQLFAQGPFLEEQEVGGATEVG